MKDPARSGLISRTRPTPWPASKSIASMSPLASTRDAREQKGRTEPAGGKIKPVRSRLKIGLPTGLIGRGQVKPCTLSGHVPQVGIEIREDGVQVLYGLPDPRNAGSCAGVLAGVAVLRQALFGALQRGEVPVKSLPVLGNG